MTTRLVRSLVALALVAPTASGWAQRQAPPAVARITPYVGLITFGSFANGPIGTRLSNQSSAIYGAQLGLSLTPNVALVGNVGYTDSNIEVGLPIIGGLKIAESKALLYDGGLQLRLPAVTSLGTGVVPYVEAGAGAIRYEVRAGPLTTKATNFAANYGGGVDLQVSRALGLRVMAKDYVGKFDFKEATGFNVSGNTAHNWVFGVGVNLGF
jgi:hypothetical protein